MIGIYKITNPNGKVYIGQSVDIERRWESHKQSKHDLPLYHSFKKYGIENHFFEVIEECKINELNEKERYYQEKYKVLQEGLNCKLTHTDDKSGYTPESVKKKISNTMLGYEFDEDRKKKVSSGVKKYFETLSEEERKKIYGKSSRSRKGQPGRKWTDEEKKQASIDRKGRKAWNKGVPMPEEQKEKLRGRKHTKEARLKMSKSLRGKKQSEETKRKRALKQMKPVSIDGKYYVSMKEASKKTCLSLYMIRKYYL